MSKLTRIIWIVLVVLINSVLVYWYAPGAKPLFDMWFLNAVQTIPSIRNVSVKVPSHDVVLQVPIFAEHKASANTQAHSLSEHGQSYHGVTSERRCVDKLEGNKAKRIYTWMDENGVRTISDNPLNRNASTPVELVAEIPPETITINFLGNDGSYALREAIKTRILNSKRFYEQVVPAVLIKPLTINLRLIDNEAKYKRYLRSVAPDSLNSQGVYITRLNESVVWIKNDEQAVRTASHEAMHSMNRHWIGQMGRWLNEGLAELAEDFESSQQTVLEPLAFAHLVTASANQWNTQTTRYYSNAHDYVQRLFLVDKNGLSRLLLAESENGCAELNLNEISALLTHKL